MQSSQIILTFDGSLVLGHSVSLRTLSYTLPHIQRAIDKTVYYSVRKEVRKFTTLPGDMYPLADIYLHAVEKGSLKIPFLSDLAGEIPRLFNAFLNEPYERAGREVLSSVNQIAVDVENRKIHVGLQNVDIVTQDDLLNREDDFKYAYAQNAVLRDIDTALSVVRSNEGSILKFAVNDDSGFREYSFDPLRASRFSRITKTKRLADPAIYTGRLLGLERQRKGSLFEYSAKFLSSLTGQESKILIAGYDDVMKLQPFNLVDEEVTIWGAPVSIMDVYDPVRGDFVFIDFYQP